MLKYDHCSMLVAGLGGSSAPYPQEPKPTDISRFPRTLNIPELNRYVLGWLQNLRGRASGSSVSALAQVFGCKVSV